MRKFKQLVGLLLALCMMLSLMPTSAFAADSPTNDPAPVETPQEPAADNAAEVNGQGYSTFELAFAAVQDGQTLKLLKDTPIAAPFKIAGKAITVDLNGHKLSGTSVANQFTDVVPASQEYNLIAVAADAALTVKDSATGGVLEINPTTGDDNAHIGVKGTFTLESGKVMANGGGYYGNLIYADGGKIYVKGGEMTVAGNGDSRRDSTLVAKNGSVVEITGGKLDNADYGNTVDVSDSTLTITSGKLDNNGNGYTINVSNSTLTISGGTVESHSTGNYMIETVSSTVKITDGTFNNNGSGYLAEFYKAVSAEISGGTFTNGATATKVMLKGYKGTYNITGGTFVDESGNGTLDDKARVSGGQFNQPVPMASCAPGKMPNNNQVGGYYTVRDITPDDVTVELTYTENGEQKTQGFVDIKAALDVAYTKSPEAKATVTVIKDYNDPTASLSAYNAYQLVIPEGITLTCSSITTSAGSATGVKLLNKGVIHCNYITGSISTGIMDNQGEIFCNYISAETDGWKNSGTIHLGVNEAKESKLENFINTGIITGTEGTSIVVKYAPVTIDGKEYFGACKWTNGAWAAAGTVSVLKANKVTASFNSLSDAYNYAETSGADTIRLEADFPSAVLSGVGCKITLDLNGHSIIKGNSQDAGILDIKAGGDLTLVDSSETKSGTIRADFGLAGVYVRSGAKFTMESGTIIGNDDRPALFIANKDTGNTPAESGATGAVATINGGTIKTKDLNATAVIILGSGTTKNYQDSDPVLTINGGEIISDKGFAITGQGNFNNTVININGGTITAKAYAAIYHPQYGRLNITGGTITGETGIAFKGGDAVISGGTIHGTGVKDYPTSGAGGGAYSTGDGFYVEDNYNRAPTVTVTGGTFKADSAAGINKLFGATKPNVENGKIVVSGGTFSGELKPEYCAPGCEPKDNGDGTFGVAAQPIVVITYTQGGSEISENYATLAAAMNRADKLPDTITDVVVTVKKNISEPNTYFYAAHASKIVIEAGAEVTCGIIKMGGVLENHGTLNAECFPYSTSGKLVNTGVINTGYMKTTATGWENTGTINVGVNGETWPSEFAQMTMGTIKADHDGYKVTFHNTDKLGSFKWSTDKWIADGAFTVKKSGDTLVRFNDFNDAMAYAAANGGDTIALVQDAELVPVTIVELGLTPAMTIDHNITLDLGGHSIRWAASEQNKTFNDAHAFFEVKNGAKVKVIGEGTVDTKLGNNTSYGFWLNDAKAQLTIENGTFTGAPSAVQVSEGKLNVTGGTFQLADGVPETQAKYVINCIDANYKTGAAKVGITGGKFVGFDPSDNPEGADTTYVAPGYEAVDNTDGSFGIAKIMVAEVNGTQYATLEEAIAAANAGDTVTLIHDLSITVDTEEARIKLFKKLTLDFNGFNIYMDHPGNSNWAAIFVGQGGDLTLKDSSADGLGGVKWKSGGNYCFHVAHDTAKLTIESGVYYGDTTAINLHKGDVYITGGTFKVKPYQGSYEYTLNCIDSQFTAGLARFHVMGGSYFKFNPAASMGEPGGPVSLLADGYETVQSGDNWIVQQIMVAEVNGKQYATLKEALAAATEGQTVKLLTNVSSDTYVFVETSITLDLNQHTLSIPGNNCMAVRPNVELTLTNGTFEGGYLQNQGVVNVVSAVIKGGSTFGAVYNASGTIKIDAGSTIENLNGGPVILNSCGTVETSGILINRVANEEVISSGTGDQNSTITVLAGKLEAAGEGGSGIIVGPGGHCTVNGGEIIAGGYTISGNGNWSNTVITVTGGKLTAGAIAIYHPQKGELNISGDAVLTGKTGVQFCSGTITISGGTIHATGADERAKKEGDGPILDGAAVSVVDRAYPGGKPTVNITGGKFISDNVEAVTAYVWSNNQASDWADAKNNLKISGGTFSSDPAAYVADGYESTHNAESMFEVVKGYVAEVNGKQYATLEEAIAAATEGQTVKLLKDITLEKTIVIDKNITLDLGGKTVTAGNGLNVNSGKEFMFETTADVTIQNGVVNSSVSRGIHAFTGTLNLKNIQATTFKRALGVEHATANVDAACVLNIAEGGKDAPVVVYAYDKTETAEHPTLNFYGKADATKAAASYAAIQGNGSDHSYTYINVFEGAELKSSGTAIYAPQNGEVVISGGTLTGYSAIGIKSGTLEISGGVLNATGEYVENLESVTNGINEDGSAIVIDSNGGYAGLVDITIGGTAEINSAHGHIIREIGNAADETSVVDVYINGGRFTVPAERSVIRARTITDGKISIDAGSFSKAPEAKYIDPDYCATEQQDGYFEITANPVASINGVQYPTLEAALKAVKKGETVKLLRDSAGNGVVIPSGSDFTLDLGGHTYTIDGRLVGSAGTVTNGFQLLKDSNIVFKNGTLNAGSDAAMLIQNYSNLTLEDVQLVGGARTQYVLSNNCGNINLTGSTGITATEGKVAFDVCKFASYEIPNVHVNTTGTIEGKLEITGGNLTIEAGKFEGHVDYRSGSVAISGGSYTEPVKPEHCAPGFAPTEQLPDGSYGVNVASEALIVEQQVYTTLVDALSKAKSGETVQLLKNVETPFVMVPAGVTMDLNGFNLKASYVSAFGFIEDSKTNARGKLVVANAMFQKNNPQLPIYDTDGYTFCTMTMQQVKTAQSQTSFAIGLMPVINGKKSETIPYFGNGATDNKIQIGVRVTWTRDDGSQAVQDFVFTDELIQNGYRPGQMLTVKVGGVENLKDLQAYSFIRSMDGITEKCGTNILK